MENKELQSLDEKDTESISGGGEKWNRFKEGVSKYASKGAGFVDKHAAQIGAGVGAALSIAALAGTGLGIKKLRDQKKTLESQSNALADAQAELNDYKNLADGFETASMELMEANKALEEKNKALEEEIRRLSGQ